MEKLFWFTCPQCSAVGKMDDDQRCGRVSVQCPNCEYHKTHDWRFVISDSSVIK